MTPKLFVATSTALVIISLLAIAGSGLAPWSLAVVGGAVAYVVLMRSAMTDESAGPGRSRTAGLALTIVVLGLCVLCVVLLAQGVSMRDTVVIVAFTLILMAVVCGVLFPVLWVISRIAPGLLGLELAGAVADLKRGRRELALKKAERYVERRPESPWGWLMSATALLGLSRAEDALAHADRAVAAGDLPPALVVRALALTSLGLLDEACRDFRAASPRGQPGAGLASVYGYTLIGLRRLDDAVAVLTDPAASSAEFVHHAMLGDVHRLLGKAERADAAYEEAVRRAKTRPPADDDSRAILASCLAMLGRLDEASAVAEAVLAGRPDNTAALSVIALIAARQRDTDKTYDALRRMLMASRTAALGSLTDPLFTPLLSEVRFRELLAWAIGAQRQTRERMRHGFPHLFP